MKHLPNTITALRIVGSIGILFCNVARWQFWTLYVFCGISDMIDGWLARELQAESKTGSVLGQQKSLHRTTSSEFVEDVRRNVMGRYFLVGLVFNFGRMNASQSSKVERAIWEMAY